MRLRNLDNNKRSALIKDSDFYRLLVNLPLKAGLLEMNLNRTRVIYAALVVALYCGLAYSQDEVFSDPAVEYSFTVPGPAWKASVRPSSTSSNLEYVYGDRRDGHLLIRKITVASNAILADVIQDEAEKKLQFLPGYVAGKEEIFNGKLNGSAFNYEYVSAGRPMAGRIYFLRNDTTVYILRFTGPKDELRRIRNQTDLIARTFSVKRA